MPRGVHVFSSVLCFGRQLSLQIKATRAVKHEHERTPSSTVIACGDVRGVKLKDGFSRQFCSAQYRALLEICVYLWFVAGISV